MGIISWIIIGGLAGWVASMIMKTNAQMGATMNVLVGVIGGILGGWLMGMMFGIDAMGFSFTGFLTALLGSVMLLGFARLMSGTTTHHTHA